ncbi:MAG: hypothetical protein C4520_08620 [Candidatus Abyssobacteria bacterium SURF_5]|uniref:Uncharacterized protein n=1 Tax=Abyssobacteria bacterium (strain SURF_5) TaxID=2093360 RepID=A0A3A4P2Q3_ABYX5|nr:MAG: hypothetical protein C4520_08620 [Candidatus Abyssubacteria bacterium SURF_5]
MAYCQGCGAYVGDYSFYRQKLPGKGEMILCYRCNRWSQSHPGRTGFPERTSMPYAGKSRIKTFSTIYIISSIGVFAAGAAIVISGGGGSGIGILIVIGSISLFLVGRSMRKYIKNEREEG